MILNKWKSALAGALMFFAATSAQAIGPVFEIGLYVGGDELATAEFADGRTESVDAGGFIDLSAGMAFDLSEQWLGRLMFGYRFDDITASNGDVEWDRLVVEAKVFRKSEWWYVGGGITYHLDPEFSASGGNLLTPVRVDYDDALGILLEANYVLPTGLYFGGKFTLIDYEAPGITNSGNSLGVIAGWQFD